MKRKRHLPLQRHFIDRAFPRRFNPRLRHAVSARPRDYCWIAWVEEDLELRLVEVLFIDARRFPTIAGCQAAGLRTLATSGAGTRELDELIDAGELAVPTAWIFGNEARGLSPELLAAADQSVRVPIYGTAESLNLAAAAAICLYGSARAQRAGR